MWQSMQRDGELWTAVWWWHVTAVTEMAIGRGAPGRVWLCAFTASGVVMVSGACPCG